MFYVVLLMIPVPLFISLTCAARMPTAHKSVMLAGVILHTSPSCLVTGHMMAVLNNCQRKPLKAGGCTACGGHVQCFFFLSLSCCETMSYGVKLLYDH